MKKKKEGCSFSNSKQEPKTTDATILSLVFANRKERKVVNKNVQSVQNVAMTSLLKNNFFVGTTRSSVVPQQRRICVPTSRPTVFGGRPKVAVIKVAEHWKRKMIIIWSTGCPRAKERQISTWSTTFLKVNQKSDSELLPPHTCAIFTYTRWWWWRGYRRSPAIRRRRRQLLTSNWRIPWNTPAQARNYFFYAGCKWRREERIKKGKKK